MSRHPFTLEDMRATRLLYYHNEDALDAMIQAMWASAVKRGAVEETYSAPGPNQHVDAYIIKLPEDTKT